MEFKKANHNHTLPEIQGLRAIAVMAVILFHFFPDIFPNGFLGVDIFFVISGFLIIKFLNEKNATALDFYKRRILRILPAITLLILFNIIAGYLLYSSNLIGTLAQNIWASASFSNNYYLGALDSYFSPNSKYNSLLHIWSLAVEVQFYLIAPLILLVTKKKLFYYLIFVFSLAAFVWMSFADNQIPFYSLFARLWEFCLGGIVFFFSSTNTDGFKFQPIIKIIILLVLILTILFPNILISISSQVIMYFVVCLSSALLIFFVSIKERHLLLGDKISIFVGDISYELYLWHWSILSFILYMTGGFPLTKHLIVAILIVFVLSYLSYKCVGSQIRKFRTSLAAIIVISIYSGVGFLGKNFLLQSSEIDQAHLSRVNLLSTFEADFIFTHRDAQRYPLEAGSGVGVFEAKPQNGNCLGLGKEAYWCTTVIREGRTTGTWALLGDSKMQYLFPGLVRNLPDKSLVLIARPSCAPLSGVKYKTKIDRPNLDKCEVLSQKAFLNIATSNPVDTVILTFASRSYYDFADVLVLIDNPVGNSSIETKYSKNFFLGLKNTVSKLIQSKKQVLLLLDNPHLAEPTECFPIEKKLGFSLPRGNQKDNCLISKKDHLKRILPIREMFLDLKDIFPQLIIVDPTDTLCHPDFCSIKKNDKFLYHQHDHYSDYANELVTKLIIDTVQNTSK